MVNHIRKCWCGNENLVPFSAEYGECQVCGTLVSLVSLSNEQLTVRDDETDFYGKQYWLNHQDQDLGLPDIYTRARNDLTERNLHWLKTLLKYCLPPASTLELGCSHGSFVALMRQAGYDGTGLEMSSWVVGFGKETFGVPIQLGPVENLDIPKESLDAIVLMDVLEHLPEPESTMQHCLNLLKPSGLLLIQTPQFQEGMRYEALLSSQSSFLEQLKADEHLYLFSKRSVIELFRRIGADYIQFEKAIFDHYDMFLAVSRTPLKEYQPQEIDSSLLSSPSRRIALALLDLRKREQDLSQKLNISEIDREARLEQIKALSQKLTELEVASEARLEQVETLTNWIKQDREANEVLKAEQEVLKTEQDVLKAEQKSLRAEQEALLEEMTSLKNRLTTKIALKVSHLLQPILKKNI